MDKENSEPRGKRLKLVKNTAILRINTYQSLLYIEVDTIMCLCCCRLPLANYLSEPCVHYIKLGLDATSVENGNMHGVLGQFSQTVVSTCPVHRTLGMRQANKRKINTDCKVGGIA